MQFLNKNIKNINIIFTVIILVFLWFYTYHLFKNIVIFDIDDLNSTYAPYPIWREENGRFVCHIISRIFCVHLPNLLGMNLQDAANTIGLYAYILIITLVCSISALFTFIKEKSLFIFNLLLIFSMFSLSYFMLLPRDVNSQSSITFQYGYVLATFFSLSFIYILFNNLLNKNRENQGKYKLILASILSFCAGNSTQIAVYSNAITVSLIILYIIFDNKFNYKEIKNILADKNILYPILAFFMGALLMVSCPGFWIELSWRHAQSIQEILENFIPFTKNFICVVFIQKTSFIKFFSILILLFISKNIYLNKSAKETIKIIVLAIIPIISICIYHYTLITLGPTFPDINLKYWLYESFYYFYFIMTYCAIFSFLIGNILYDIDKFSFRTGLIILILLMFFASFGKKFFEDFNFSYKKTTDSIKHTRKNVYICDKILITQINKAEKELVLPEFCLTYTIYPGNEIKRYIKSVYKTELNNEIKIVDEKTAFNKFYSLGGCIKNEETSKVKFNSLRVLAK